MHSLTAVEAYFTYMGVYWHSEIVRLLASDHFVRSIFLLVFGLLFMTTVIQLFARQMGTSVIPYGYVTVGTVVKVVVCYLLGLAALKVQTTTSVRDFGKEDWRDNPYVVSRIGQIDKDLQMSLPVDLMIRSAEEFSWVVTRVTDHLMGGPHSASKAPNLYYKAMLLAGATTFEDPKIRSMLELYTEDCIDPVLPLAQERISEPSTLANFLNLGDALSDKLSTIVLSNGSTCSDLRQEVRNTLYKSAFPISDKISGLFGREANISNSQFMNYGISSALLNFYVEKNESGLGVVDGGQVAGTYGRILQYLGKLVSHEGLLRLTGHREQAGAGIAVSRAKEFNEQLRLAPMVLGLSKAGLIVAAAFLPFFMVAMRWRVVIWWWLVYLSVCMWAPIWTGLYKLITNVFAVPEFMENFGRLEDSFSMYSAMLISDQAYYISSVISWAQIAVGPGLTGLVGFFAGQWLLSSREDHMPEAIQQVANTASTGSMISRSVGGFK